MCTMSAGVMLCCVIFRPPPPCKRVCGPLCGAAGGGAAGGGAAMLRHDVSRGKCVFERMTEPAGGGGVENSSNVYNMYMRILRIYVLEHNTAERKKKKIKRRNVQVRV